MHSTSALWKEIFAEMNHQKEVKVAINGTEYGQKRIISAEISGRLFDTPGVGNAFSRKLKLVIVPYTGANGNIPPLSEIRLYVRLVSADGLTVSEYIPKGVFYADTVQKDSDTGAVTISAFDAIMRLEAQFGVPKEGGGTEPARTFTVSFDDGFKNIQKFQVASGGAMPTPTTPTHDGEQFLSWYPDPADTPTVTRDMRFVAKWAQKYTVIFEDGSDTPQVFTCSAGDATPTPATPEKSGFNFNGWLPTPTETVTGDATYTAQWAGVTSVAIVAYPTKTDYFVGETLDYTGLSVVLTYANGTTEDVTADCTLLPAEGTTISEPGDIMVDVRYNGKSLGTFWVAVEVAGEGVIVTVIGEPLYDIVPFPYPVITFLNMSGIYPYNDETGTGFPAWEGDNLQALIDAYNAESSSSPVTSQTASGYAFGNTIAVTRDTWNTLSDFVSWVVSHFSVTDNQTGVELGGISDSYFTLPVYTGSLSGASIVQNGYDIFDYSLSDGSSSSLYAVTNNSRIKGYCAYAYYSDFEPNLYFYVCVPLTKGEYDSFVYGDFTSSYTYSFHPSSFTTTRLSLYSLEFDGATYYYAFGQIGGIHSSRVTSIRVPLYDGATGWHDGLMAVLGLSSSASFSGVTADTTTVSPPAALPSDTPWGGMRLTELSDSATVATLEQAIENSVQSRSKLSVMPASVNISGSV